MIKDWTQLYKKHRGQWVALAKDEKTVLGSGKTVSIAVKQAKEKTKETPFLTRVPSKLVSYVGLV